MKKTIYLTITTFTVLLMSCSTNCDSFVKSKTKKYGIDVSHYQNQTSKIDWEKVSKAKFAALTAKSTSLSLPRITVPIFFFSGWINYWHFLLRIRCYPFSINIKLVKIFHLLSPYLDFFILVTTSS